MNEKIGFPDSPVAETAKQVLEKCSDLGYPPEAWALPDVEIDQEENTTFSSLWRQMTGQAKSASREALSFSWDPDELAKRSSEFLAIHKTVILKQLGPRQGTATEIDLFGWFWKSLLETYVRSVSSSPFPAEFSEFTSLTFPTGKATPDERQQAIKFASELNVDPETAENIIACYAITNGSNFYSDFEGWGGWGKNLGFTRSFCFPSGFVEGGLDADIIQMIGDNDPLKLRLLYWWGWPDSPFMSMQRMIREHTEHMVDEGYLRLKAKASGHSPARYSLTDSGLLRLKELDPDGKFGLLDYIRVNDLVGLGANLSSLCQFLFPR
jgi:hypothetical protein